MSPPTNGPGSGFPSASISSRYTSQMEPSDGMNPSAMRAARRAAFGPLPPRTIGGPPGCAGVGRICTVRPRNSNGSPVHACLSVATVSVVRRTRSESSQPNIANSPGT